MRSKGEKLGVVREEADESSFWLEFLERAKMLPSTDAEGTRLRRESAEIFAMVSAAYRTGRERYGKSAKKAKGTEQNPYLYPGACSLWPSKASLHSACPYRVASLR